MNLEECLPAELRTLQTSITRIAAGMSGAGVYRVEHAGRAYVLKVAVESEPLERFRSKLHVLEQAARVGLAPRMVHADEARRAVLSELVQDRIIGLMLAGAGTREAAIGLLGRTLRRVHELPLPADAEPANAHRFLSNLWSGVSAGGFSLPGFVRERVESVLGETAPTLERALVYSHNDVNPTNLVYDGERLFLLDWETAAPNDPYYDLATLSLYYRLPEPACRRLLEAYDGVPAEADRATASTLPAGFRYNQRLASGLCGTMFLHLARLGGHPGATGQETLETTQPLFEVYQRARAGAINLGSPEGQWAFGLALIHAGANL